MDTINDTEVGGENMSARLKSGIKIHKDRPKGTMVVRRIVNLTNIVLNFYDQFGHLVTLPPEELKLQHDGKLPIVGDGTFFAVDESVDEALLTKLQSDDSCKYRLATPRSIGKIHDGKEGYHLIATGQFGRQFFVITSGNPKLPIRPILV